MTKLYIFIASRFSSALWAICIRESPFQMIYIVIIIITDTYADFLFMLPYWKCTQLRTSLPSLTMHGSITCQLSNKQKKSYTKSLKWKDTNSKVFWFMAAICLFFFLQLTTHTHTQNKPNPSSPKASGSPTFQIFTRNYCLYFSQLL